jgi:hypothetical protein
VRWAPVATSMSARRLAPSSGPTIVAIVLESGDQAKLNASRQPLTSSRGGALPSAGTTMRSGRKVRLLPITMNATVRPSGEIFGDDPEASRRAPDPSSAAIHTLERFGFLL